MAAEGHRITTDPGKSLVQVMQLDLKRAGYGVETA